MYLRRRAVSLDLLYDRHYRNPPGTIVMLVGIAVSVPLFASQTLFTGLVPRAVPGVGDIAFFVGFAIAAALYAALFQRLASDRTTGDRAARTR
jgi:NCS1 family nucleobase:cation symporter-1